MTVFVGACALTTSLEGLSSGPATPIPDDGGDGSRSADDASGAEASVSLPTACKDLIGATPSKADGYYRIDPDGIEPLPAIEVYCDMSTAGGGWTLVARTIDGSSGNFGWNVATGGVRDDAAPYSLGVASAGLAFTAILVGVRGAGKSLTGSAYTLDVGSAFMIDQANAATAVVPASARGTCAPAGGPSMFRFVGFTKHVENFFFRDTGGLRDEAGTSYGLFSFGFRSRYDDCGQGGITNGKQGEIFVR